MLSIYGLQLFYRESRFVVVTVPRQQDCACDLGDHGAAAGLQHVVCPREYRPRQAGGRLTDNRFRGCENDAV
jgi:hypothetical protein